MTLTSWFQSQLRATSDGFLWAIEQLPPERRHVRPPNPLGEWTASRHVFHMLYYEQQIALPSMHLWLGGPAVSEDDYDEDKAWGAAQNLEDMLIAFRDIRNEQIALLTKFDEHLWLESRQTVWGPATEWGPITLRWVVSKTFQHTAEHTHDVMAMVLFWNYYLARQQDG